MIIPIILCGGSGRRLWPASRPDFPKQFLPLLGARSLFQQTLLRVSDPDAFERPIVVAAEALRFVAADQARRAGVEIDLLLEPEAKGTALAIAAAAAHAAARSPGALALTLASDHAIEDAAAYQGAVAAGRAAARAGRILAFGVPPAWAETEYGYLVPGDPLPEAPARSVARMIEKPAPREAEAARAAGALWNSGDLLFAVDALRSRLSATAPATLAASEAAYAAAKPDLSFLRLGASAYAAAPSGAIETLLLERDPAALALIETRCGWADIGDWRAVWARSARDADGNAALGSARFLRSTGCLAHAADGLTVATLGVDDLIVAATRDAVLVADKSEAKAVRDLVEALDRDGSSAARAHPQSFRPWGSFEAIARGDRYQVKKIVVDPGGALSLQKHHHRSEHWIVVKGTAEVVRDAEELIVRENESVYLPQGCVHRLSNPGKIPLELIEVQVGSYLGEDDIVRLEDVYNRTE